MAEDKKNEIAISKINHDMSSLEKQISDVAEGLKDVVTKSELARLRVWKRGRFKVTNCDFKQKLLIV